MPFIWIDDPKIPDEVFGEYIFKKSPDPAELMIGVKAESNFGIPNIKFDIPVAQIKMYDCLPTTCGIPLISRRLMICLSKLASDDAEFIPSLISDESNKKINEYYFINILKTFPCVNKDKSKIYPSMYEESTIRIRPGGLSLLDNCMQGATIVRDSEKYSLILVSNYLEEELTKNGFVGLAFIPPDRYS